MQRKRLSAVYGWALNGVPLHMLGARYLGEQKRERDRLGVGLLNRPRGYENAERGGDRSGQVL